jgi:hypothetical protein
MKTNTLSKLFAAAITSSTLVPCMSAVAMPINGVYIEDARCDVLPNQTFKDELGDALNFPINEGIVYTVSPAPFTVCVPDDGAPNDWIVDMMNVSGQAWQDLFFVTDLGVFVGNADGSVFDVAGAPGAITDAFRIDGTVTAGINSNLLGESGAIDEIFSPGESWRFAVSNFSPINTAGFFMTPMFVTPGIFSGSSPFPSTPGNASILANPVVPEPTTAALLVVGGAGLLLRRPRRA